MAVAVPIAATKVAAITIALVNFGHAISFNAPWSRNKVEPLAAAPFAAATTVTDFINAIGAA
jgi:hypothetical protein